MNLVDLIDEFKEASGRIDLDDATILKHINRGSRLLDRRSKREKSESRAHTALQPLSYIMTTDPDLRYIKQVWASTTTKRWQIGEIDLAVIREYYNTYPHTVSPGDVTSYALTTATLAPGGTLSSENPSAEFWPQFTGDALFSNSSGYRAMILYPVPEEVTVIEIIGTYYTQAIRDEIGYDKNWWSINHSQLLVHAALITLDANYRNTSGAKELYAFIDEELREIFYDDIEEELYQPSAMGGSEYGFRN